MYKMKNYKRFDKSFKVEAVRLALTSSQAMSKTARDLGVKDTTLYYWVTEERNKTKPKTPDSSSEINLVDELNRLRKENIRLKEEREILKKAAAFFAKEQE